MKVTAKLPIAVENRMRVTTRPYKAYSEPSTTLGKESQTPAGSRAFRFPPIRLTISPIDRHKLLGKAKRQVRRPSARFP